MSRNAPARRAPEKKPDGDDFPTIPILSKKGPSIPTSHPVQLFQPIDVQSPEALLQTDMSQQEFAHAILSSIELIPDVPFEVVDYKPQTPADPEACADFPQSPNMKLLQPEFFRRYDISTLFYIFFYFPGTAPQYFAGKELKQRGWRFHTKHNTWFHRIAEATEVTDRYEVGKFEYLDHKEPNGWCVKQRDGFTLEYEFVETD